MPTMPWFRTVLNVVLILATMCSGVAIPRDWPPSGAD